LGTIFEIMLYNIDRDISKRFIKIFLPLDGEDKGGGVIKDRNTLPFFPSHRGRGKNVWR